MNDMKKITVAVCVDDDMQTLFFGKRQSRDRVLIEDLVSSSKEKVFINSFSEPIFSDKESYILSENPMEDCPQGGVVFAENFQLLPYISFIEKLILYRWNRKYPGDKKLDIDISQNGLFRLEEVFEFVGSSHERITKEIYTKKQDLI